MRRTPDEPPLLEARNLETATLRGAALDLRAGDCLTIQGASGSGKTLLLRALADLDPVPGALALAGTDRETVPAPEWRRRVALVPAETAWWADRVGPHFDAWDTAARILRRLDLPTASASWPIARLSTGERQRLGLARALARDPAVLLLDEPTSALDQDNTARVEAEIADFRAAGGGVVWVTHDAAQAARVGTRAARIADGRLEGAA